MLAVSERIPSLRLDRPDEVIWHKPVGADPDATFQRIACSEDEGIALSSGKREVSLRLSEPGQRWCSDCLTIVRRKK
ncbi:hypothetical protein KEF29_02970 [Streptomyces tuirus]|uniref:Uncharacterized protein n=1 Tax=Streptomyces tuirus TaxID=68278 RepID=A0A941F8G2_9ACTN|nr:hypothetical protein [Streptomyces tuirus]